MSTGGDSDGGAIEIDKAGLIHVPGYRCRDRLRADRAGIVPIDTIKRIDIPPPPADVLEIFTDGGKLEVPLAEVREKTAGGCEYCPDMTAEFSDVSVGVFEGRPDLNTLIIRTDAGAGLVTEAERNGYLILGDMPRENLDHLTGAAENKKKKALSKNREEGLLNAFGAQDQRDDRQCAGTGYRGHLHVAGSPRRGE